MNLVGVYLVGDIPPRLNYRTAFITVFNLILYLISACILDHYHHHIIIIIIMLSFLMTSSAQTSKMISSSTGIV